MDPLLRCVCECGDSRALLLTCHPGHPRVRPLGRSGTLRRRPSRPRPAGVSGRSSTGGLRWSARAQQHGRAQDRGSSPPSPCRWPTPRHRSRRRRLRMRLRRRRRRRRNPRRSSPPHVHPASPRRPPPKGRACSAPATRACPVRQRGWRIPREAAPASSSDWSMYDGERKSAAVRAPAYQWAHHGRGEPPDDRMLAPERSTTAKSQRLHTDISLSSGGGEVLPFLFSCSFCSFQMGVVVGGQMMCRHGRTQGHFDRACTSLFFTRTR